jgi:hypothetical protein
VGIEQLLSHLQHHLGGSVYEKALVDLRRGCGSLLGALGGGSSVDFEARWSTLVDDVVARVEESELSQASQLLLVFLDQISDEVGGPIGDSIGDVATGAPQVLLSATPAMASAPPRRRWWKAAPGDQIVDGRPVKDALDSGVAQPVRELLAKRAKAQASVAELSLALNSLTSRPR